MSAAQRLVSPYVGLTPYAEENAPFFFGRERERKLIIANLMASRLTLLYGPSGVGKSSVLRAGVVHHLHQLVEQQRERGRPAKYAVAMYNSWSEDPVSGLLKAVHESVARAASPLEVERSQIAYSGTPRASGSTERGQAVRQEIKSLNPSHSLGEALNELTSPFPQSPSASLHLLIILDQFEEFFLYPNKPGERSFAEEFPSALSRKDLHVNFLLSMREDYIASLDRFKGHIPYLFDNSLRIRHLNREAARSAIINPVEKYNSLYGGNGRSVEVESQLVEAVLEQVKVNEVLLGEAGRGSAGNESGATAAEAQVETPYLQLVMTRLWQVETDNSSRTMRLTTLQRLGGAGSIVRSHVDAVMENLSAEEQEIAARIFHYLVTPSGTKIAYLPSDLASLTELPEERLSGVLATLSGEGLRVLTIVDPPPDRPNNPRYEIRHDALAPAILDWRTRFAKKQATIQANQKLALERGRVRKLWLGLGLLTLLLLGMVALVVNTYRLNAKAQTLQGIGLSYKFATRSMTEKDSELAVLLAAEAARAGNTTHAEEALRQALFRNKQRAVFKGHDNWVNSAVFSPDGKHILSVGGDSRARIWDVSTGQSIELKGHNDAIFNGSFSPKGSLVATASDDRTARIWDAQTGREVAVLKGHKKRVKTVNFSPDERFVVTASYDNAVGVWEARTGQNIAMWAQAEGGRSEDNQLNSAVYSPDSRFIVAASWNNCAWVLNAQTGQLIARLSHDSMVYTAVFNRQGTRIVTASQDGTARVWDTEGHMLARLPETGNYQNIYNAEFSPDGNSVVTSGKDALPRVWAWTLSEGRKNPVVLKGHDSRDGREGVHQASFSPDGQNVVTAGDDGRAIVWRAAGGEVVTTLDGHQGSVFSAAFSPDGRYIVTAGKDGTARLWATPMPEVIELPPNGRWLDDIAYSPDAQYVVTSGAESAQVWSARTGQKLFSLDGSKISKVTFAPDGKHLVGLEESGVKIWDASNGKIVSHAAGSDFNTTAFAVSPDGESVFIGHIGGGARLWEMRTGTTTELQGHSATIGCAAFSPDSQYVATGSYDGSVHIFEVKTGHSIAEPERHSQAVNSISFSPNGAYVLTASDDKTARVSEAHSGQVVSVMRHNGTVLRAAFSPDSQYVVTTGFEGAAYVWEAGSGKSVAVLQGHKGQVTSATFSPTDGRLVATGGEDAKALLHSWGTQAEGNSSHVLSGHKDRVNNVVFSPDGQFVATVSKDGTARLYPWEMFAPLDDLLKVAERRVTRKLSTEEIKRYSEEK